MESLGRELGVPLVAEDGEVSFEAQPGGEEGNPIEITITAMEDGLSANMTADLGELPAEGAEPVMMQMLEANHLFEGTGGASFSAEDGRAKLERYVRLCDLGRGEGANVVMPFIAMAASWAEIVAGGANAAD